MRIARGISVTNTSRPISTAIVYDADAAAFFTAASITDTTQKSAVNQLVLDLKSANIWTKMRALYPVVGGVASAHAVNLKTPGTYNLSFATGWTHSSTGMTPNGATYANTNLIPSSVLTLNNTHLSYYSRTNRVVSEQEIGSGDNRTNFPTLVLECCSSSPRYGVYFSYNGNTLIDSPKGNSSNNDGRGFYIGSRTTSTSAKFIKNGIILGTNTTTSLGVQPNYSIFIGAQNYLGSLYVPTLKQCAFASIGDGLTDTDATNFYNAIQTMQTTLGRQV